MKAFETSFENVIYRFCLMMAVVIIGLAAGLPLLAFLALPLFLSAALGLKFKKDKVATRNAEVLPIINRNVAA